MLNTLKEKIKSDIDRLNQVENAIKQLTAQLESGQSEKLQLIGSIKSLRTLVSQEEQKVTQKTNENKSLECNDKAVTENNENDKKNSDKKS